jgi:hypothetical protein
MQGLNSLQRTVRTGIFTALVAVLAVPVVGSADEGRTVGCFVFPAGPRQQQASVVMSSIIRAQMRSLVGVQVVTGAPAGNGEAAIEATRLTNEGFTALNTGDKNGALPLFQQAFDLLAQNPGVGEIQLHARVAKGLGVASFMTGKTTRGKELIKRSLLLYSRQQATEYAYSVDVRNLFEHARREIGELQAGTVEVRSTPDGAEVYLDGEFKGYTPIPMPNVPAGSHLVEVVRDGYLRWSTAAVVAPGGRIPTEAVLTEAPQKAAFDAAYAEVSRRIGTARRSNAARRRFLAAAEELKQVSGARELLAVAASVGEGGFVLKGIFLDLAGEAHPINVTLTQDAEFLNRIRGLLSDSLQAAFEPEGRAASLGSPPAETVDTVMRESAAIGGELAIDPDSPLFRVEGEAPEESITDKWWFWTAIGGGAALVAGTVIAVVLATGEDDSAAGAVGNLNFTFESFGN